MIIRLIDWEHHEIKDIEVEEIRYVEKGIEYPFRPEHSSLTNIIFVPYKNFLGVVK